MQDSTLDLGLHTSTVLTARSQNTLSQYVLHNQQFEGLLRNFDLFCQRTILHAKDQNIFAWLPALPLVKNHFDLVAQDHIGRVKRCIKTIFSWMIHHSIKVFVIF